MSFYRNIIKDSWKSTFRNKYLWFFGLFAVLLGNGGEYEVFFRSIGGEDKVSVWSGFYNETLMLVKNLPSLGQRFMEDAYTTSVILLTYLFTLAVFLFIIWMVNVSVIAIVNTVAKEAREKEHSLKISLLKGIKLFWPVFTLNFALKILVILGIALIWRFEKTALNVILFVVLVPLLMSISFIVKYSIAYIVVRKEKLIDSVKMSWNLFKNNWIISLELAMLLYLVTLLAGIFFVFVSFNIEKFFEVFITLMPTTYFVVNFFVLPFVLLFVLAFIGAVLAVFQTTAWTKLFLELDSKGAISKIERIFSK